MPTISSNINEFDDQPSANNQFKSVRRIAHRRAKRRSTGRSRRVRRLSVRSELREQPDVQKIARAVIALAMAQAEAEAQANHDKAAGPESPDV